MQRSQWNLLGRLKNFLLAFLFFSTFIIVLYALSVSAGSNIPMQLALNGERGFVYMGGPEISKNGAPSEDTTVNLSLANGAILSNTVEILSDQMEPFSDTERSVLCPKPMLIINKDDNPPDNIQPDAVLTYTIVYGNAGNADATEVIVTDAFDNKVTFERSWPISPTGGAGNVRYWEIGDLQVGGRGNITATVIVSTSAVSGTVLTNLVQIDSPDAEMASSTETTTVVAGNRRLYLPIVANCWDIPPCEDPHEPNNARCSAHPISTSTCIESYICSPLDKSDYYYIEIITLNVIEISLTNLPADYDLYLYDSPTAFMPVAYSDGYGRASEYITYNPNQTGRYYIRVYSYNGYSDTDSYELCVRFD